MSRIRIRPSNPTRALGLRKSLLALTTVAALAVFAAPALANTYVSTPGGEHYYAASALQHWNGTISVTGYVAGSGCAVVSEQGHNAVLGYGAWKYVTDTCASGSRWVLKPFSFSVSDYYSDSVAVKICDSSGCRSAHVW